MKNFKTTPHNRTFIQIFCVNLGLLAIAFSGQKSRTLILGLGSGYFEVASTSKLIFITLMFVIFSFMAFSLLWLTVSSKSLNKDSSKYLRFLPVISFLTIIVLPIYYKYFSGQRVFTDLEYTIEFLADKSVQNVSDNDLIYPSSLLWIRKLSIPFEQLNSVFYLTIFTTIAFSFCIFHFSKQLEGLAIYIFTLLLISPPINWLIESQNLDLFIAITLYGCAIIYHDVPGPRNTLGIIVLSTIALFKLYTLPILCYLFFVSKFQVVRLQIFFGFSFLIAVLFWDAKKIFSLIPLGAENNAFGLRVLLFYLGFDREILGLVSLSLGAIIFIIFFIHSLLKANPPKQKDFVKSNIYIYNMVIFVVTMVVTSSYPFRMVFLIFIIPLLITRLNSNIDVIVAAYALVSFYCYTRSLGVISNIFLLPFLVRSMYLLTLNVVLDNFLKTKTI